MAVSMGDVNVSVQAERPGCLMLGTGEYTTGFVGGGAANSDKATGIVALVCLDLRARGKLGRLGMCGTNGKKTSSDPGTHAAGVGRRL